MFAGTGTDHEDAHAHTLAKRQTGSPGRRYDPVMGHPPPYPPYSQYPQHPTYPPPHQRYPQYPPSRAGDRVGSIIMLLLTALLLAFGSFFGLMILAFLDHCPPESCSVDGAVLSVLTAIGIAVAVGVAGLVITVVRLSRRLTSWPVALGTLLACAMVFVAGFFAFTVAVGGW